MSDQKTALVISAHSADFVWRCGGAIALHQELGYNVTVVCLSYGERGESAKLWKQDGMTLEQVKDARKAEAENAARALDVHDIQFFDCGDYPLNLNEEQKFKLVDVIRDVQPNFMLTHSQYDPYNTDHMYTMGLSLEVRMIAQAWGHNPGHPADYDGDDYVGILDFFEMFEVWGGEYHLEILARDNLFPTSLPATSPPAMATPVMTVILPR